MPIDAEMLEVLKRWHQSTQFRAADNWVFAAPRKIGRLPWSADSLNDAYKKAGQASGVGHVSTHVMRHTYRSWLDAVGTPVAVQQKLMRHADIRTTMNVYGDVVTDEMSTAHSKVVALALNGTEAKLSPLVWRKRVRVEHTLDTAKVPSAGFEDRENHRIPFASALYF
jgi:integrase